MNRCLLDSNILLREVDAAHPQQGAARTAVHGLTAQGKLLCIAPQNLMEFWAVATRPTVANGLGLTPAQAAAEIANFKAAFQLLPETPAVLPEWERIAAQYSVAGRQAHDAHLVAAMKAHSILEILTFNTIDFNRYAAGEGITVIDPLGVVAPPATTP